MAISDFKVLERILKPRRISNIYHFKPIRGFSIDSRTIKKGEAFIAVKGIYHDGHNFINQAIKRGAGLIISEKKVKAVSGVPVFLVDDTYAALKNLIYYVRKSKKPFVYAVTGSVGKTTTKDMLGFLLEDKFKVLKNRKTENNLLGAAKTVFSLADEKVMVLELGTNAPGEIRELAEVVYPDCGIITFIKPVHLQGLKSMKGIFREKTSLLKVNPAMKAVLNRDDSYLKKIKPSRNVIWFGKGKGSDIKARLLSLDHNRCRFLVQDKYELVLASPFAGFIYNALAALAAAFVLRKDLNALIERLNGFSGFAPLRMEIKESKDIVFLNDSYNANPYSFKQALKLVKKYSFPKIAVIGDMLELGTSSVYYHKALAVDIVRVEFDYVLTMGEYTVHLKDRLKEMGYNKVFHFSSHKDAAKFIKDKVNSGKKGKYMVFLKGSRKIGLEKVMNFL